VHRFQESIAGQPYLFEVAAISQNRWRACMVRIPGVPTALMPFYGPTPAEAADRLRQWLTRAHAHASGRPLSDAQPATAGRATAGPAATGAYGVPRV
jgi:hypothetical protein